MTNGRTAGEPEGTVSLRAEVPEPLLIAMRGFIERHPSWDQYRLVQAALAGFLVQNGVRNRGVTRCYLANLFPGQAQFVDPPRAGAGHGVAAPSPQAAARRQHSGLQQFQQAPGALLGNGKDREAVAPPHHPELLR